MNKSKYFVVRTKEMADKIKRITKQYYYVFDNYDGSKTFSFIRNNEVVLAYRMILSYTE